jgi:hypothetical protein
MKGLTVRVPGGVGCHHAKAYTRLPSSIHIGQECEHER